MSSLTRPPKFLIIFGVIMIILSYVSPLIQPSYTPLFELSSGTYRGIMVHCHGDIDVQIESRHDAVFSIYFMNYTNGLLAVEEGSLENVSILESFQNRTILNAHLPVPDVGWYSIVVTPSNNETIELMSIEYRQQSPNQRVLLAGIFLTVLSAPWIFAVINSKYYRKSEARDST